MTSTRRAPGLLELIASDANAWVDSGFGDPAPGGHPSSLATNVKLIFRHPGLRATVLYRLSHALHRKGIRVLPMFLHRLNLTLHGFDIPPTVPVGPRAYVPHPVGTVVMAELIGSGVTLVSGVTLGMRKEHAFPILGDNVYVGAGARVLGGIRIGNNVSIGANAVVLTDVPDNSVAVGVPARIRPAAQP